MTENLVTGKKYRILTDAVNDVWDRISFWAKASDVYFDDNTTAEANKPVDILKRSTAYTVGTVAYEGTAPSWVMLKCTTAGTTADTVPSTYSTISTVGSVITDGTAKFTVYDARPTTTLSTSACQIPAMSLVNGLNTQLTANGNQFYFDYDSSSQSYGYKLGSSGTFVPFGGTSNIPLVGYVFMIGAGASSQYAQVALTNGRATVSSGNIGTTYLINIKDCGYTNMSITFTGSTTFHCRGFKKDGSSVFINNASGSSFPTNDVSNICLIVISRYDPGQSLNTTFVFT